MLANVWRAWAAIFRAFWAWHLRPERGSSDLDLAAKALFTVPSWRIQEKMARSPLGGLQLFPRVLKRHWAVRLPGSGSLKAGIAKVGGDQAGEAGVELDQIGVDKAGIEKDGDRKAGVTGGKESDPGMEAGVSAVFSRSPEEEAMRREYMWLCTGRQDFLYIPRTQLNARRSLPASLLFSLLHFSTFLFLQPWLLFSKRRANYQLLLKEFPELAGLLQVVQEAGVTDLYYFGIFEKDSNLATWLLRKRGVKVHKIAADIPLAFVNQIILADSLFTCLKYQEEEVAALKATIRVGKLENWIPEKAMDYVGKYDLPADYATPPNTLGFYSSGAWARKLEGHADYGDGFFEAEEILINCLRDYMADRKDQLELRIFMHPVEKRTAARLAKARAYYDAQFKGLPYRLMPAEMATPNAFHEADVAVSVYSNVSFERLFMGFKSLIFPYGMDHFPIPGSGMDRISAKTAAELFDKLDHNLALSREAYLKENLLDGYSIDYFQSFFERSQASDVYSPGSKESTA